MICITKNFTRFTHGEGPLEVFSIYEIAQPVDVILPHLSVGNIRDVKPFWIHFLGFYRLWSSVLHTTIDMTVLIPLRFVWKSEMQQSAYFELLRRDCKPCFFGELSPNSIQDGFYRSYFPTCPVPVSSSKSALFHREKYLVFGIEYKYKRADFRLHDN